MAEEKKKISIRLNKGKPQNSIKIRLKKDQSNHSSQTTSPQGSSFNKNANYNKNNTSNNKNSFSKPPFSKPPFSKSSSSKPPFSKPPFSKSSSSKPTYTSSHANKNNSKTSTQSISTTSEFQKNTRRVTKTDFNSKKKKEFDKFDKQEADFELLQKKSRMAASVPSSIEINETILVSELARKMNIKAATLITKLMELGYVATINDALDAETAEIAVSDFNCQVIVKSHVDELDKLIQSLSKDKNTTTQSRPPVVTIMGHVDHGKTTLLDYIRQAHVVKSESGGITQHIGAYQVNFNNQDITFIDTPGHAAFTQMRERGASITDIVVLVVAIDDGIMPQTIEALNHAQAANVPIIVAVNKIDKTDKGMDLIKTKLSEFNLTPEEWGGDTLYIPLSALTGAHVDNLLESILLISEVKEYKASPDQLGKGVILESKMDKNRGSLATCIIQDGTLKKGDLFVSGVSINRVKAIFNHHGDEIQFAGPSTPVEILGFEEIPSAGDFIYNIPNDKIGREIVEKKKAIRQIEHAKKIQKQPTQLDDLYAQIKQQGKTEFNVIIKADVQGTAEAIQSMLKKLASQIEEINLKVIHSAVGAITENDVLLASTSNALVIGFNVRMNNDKANQLVKEKNVEVRRYSIIYEINNDIKNAIEGILEPEKVENIIGEATVRQIFKIPKVGLIAGCIVNEGVIKINSSARVIQEGIVVFTGKIQALKRLKEDVKEVNKGFECGIYIHNYHDFKVNDVIEVFEIKNLARKLELKEI